MANWSSPGTGSQYAATIDELKNRDLDVAMGLDPAVVVVTNPVAGMIRWSSAASRDEKFNGTAWVPKASLYSISISGTASNITGTLLATKGGTGHTSYAVGDMLVANSTTTLSKLASSAAGNALISNGVGAAPFWGTVPIGGGGTGATTPAAARTALGATPIGASVFTAVDAAAVRAALDVGFPSGTKMLFVQTSSPTGWTKDTTHNNKALRVVSGAAGSGGSIDFTTAFATKAVNGLIGSTTLTIGQIPSHNHPQDPSALHNRDHAGLYGGGGFGNQGYSTGYTGGSNSHNHSFSGSNIDLTVKYVDVIIATKD